MKVPRLEPLRVPLDGLMRGAVLMPPDRICMYQQRSSSSLVCFDVSGRQLWQRELRILSRRFGSVSLRVSLRGVLWVGLEDCLVAFDANGTELQSLALPLESGEYLGSFVCVTDGFLASVYRQGQPVGNEGVEDLTPRVLRLDEGGWPCWTTALPIDSHHFEGIVEARAETGWKTQAKPAWRPRNWTADVYVRDPILLSGNRLLASYIDISSGLGVSYCLNTTSGELCWRTPTLPFHRRAIGGQETFLLGAGGYGMMPMTQLRGADGEVLQEWHRNGAMCVLRTGEVRLVEEFIQAPRAVQLGPDSTFQGGPSLAGTYTTSPVLTRGNELLFWRGGSLFLLDKDFKLHTLATIDAVQDHAPVHRMLLCPDGTLVLALYEHHARHYEAWFVKTPFELQNDSPWPCADGNVSGNPCWL